MVVCVRNVSFNMEEKKHFCEIPFTSMTRGGEEWGGATHFFHQKLASVEKVRSRAGEATLAFW